MSTLWSVVTSTMRSWHAGKVAIENAVPVSHDSIHVIVGLLLWLAFAMLLRRPITSRLPWLWVLAVILWNETVDLWNEQWPDPWMQYRAGLKDILLTMFVPTVLVLAAWLRPGLFRPGSGISRGRRWRFGSR